MKKHALSWLSLVFKAWSKGRMGRLVPMVPGISISALLTWTAGAGDFVWDNAGTNIGSGVTTTVNYTAANSWNPDGSNPSGLFDNIVFAAAGFAGTNAANTALNLDLQTTAYNINGIFHTANAATSPDNVTVNLVGGTGAGLTLNQILKSAGGTLQVGPTVPVSSVIGATNPTGKLVVTNTDNSAIQLQGTVTTAGDLIRNGTGGGILRLGTSGSTFTNAISGNIVINAGSLELAANNAGNVAGGAGRAIVMNSPNGTINFRTLANMDFAREIDINAFRTIFSADRSAGTTVVGQTITTGTLNVNRNDSWLVLNSGNSFGYQFDGINLGSNTLNLRNGLSGGAKANVGVLSGSGMITVSGSGDNNTAGLTFGTASPGFSGTVRFLESIGSSITATGALGSGKIILGADTPTAPVTFPNPDIGTSSPAVRSQGWSAGLNYNANNPTTAAVAVDVYGGSSVNMGVVPGSGDVIQLREYGIIQGDDAELGAFTVGTNLLLPARNAIISHEVVNGVNPASIGTGANHFYGMAVDHTSVNVTVGADTAWKGLSTDRFARTLGGVGSTLTVNGGDNDTSTVEATLLAVNGKALNLFTGGGTWVSGSGSKATVEIAGVGNVFNTVSGTGGLGGTVFFQSDAATSGIASAVDKLLVSGTLQAQGANMFGGVPVEVLNGGGIDPGATNTFDTNVTFQSGGRLLHNDNMTFTGSGTLTFNGGSHFYITGSAPVNTLTASTQPLVISGTGHTVRVGVNEVLGLDLAVPDTGANWEIAAATTTSAPAGTTLTGVPTLTQSAGITTDGGSITNDQGGNRALIGPVNIGSSGATVAATTGTSLILMNAVNAGGGNAPLQIGSATPINNINKVQQQVAVSNNSATLNAFSGSTAVIFEGGLKSGTVNVVQHDLYLDGPTANTQITGDINLGESSRLYLGGGGSINTGNAFGAAAPRRGDLTPNIIAGTVATGTINLGNNGRIEMAVDHTDPAYTASLVGGRGQVAQSFTVAAGADLNPQDRRNLWVDRGANTTVAPGIDLNNITLGNGSNLSIQESGTDIRATVNLTGANAIVSPGNGSAWDFKDINNIGGGAKSISLGRTDQPLTEFGIYGTVGGGVSINNVKARLAVRPGSTISSDFVFTDSAASRTPFNNFGTTPGGTNNGSDHTLSIVKGSDGVSANYLNTGTFNSNAGNAFGFYVQDNASTQVRNEVGAAININAAGGTLFADRDGADAAVNGVVKLNTVNLNAANTTLATRNFADLEIGTLNVTQNAVVKSDGGRSDIAGNANGAVRIGNVAAGANDVQFQNGRTTITGNITADVLTAAGTSLEFNPGGSGTSTVNATSVQVNSLLAAKAGTTNFGSAILKSNAVGTTVAGLREGVIAGNAINIAGANPASTAATANSNDASNLGIRLDPRIGQNNASTGGTLDTARGWGDNQTWVYSGQIYDADGLFTLAENIDDSVQIVIDGQVRLFNRNSTSVIGGSGQQQVGPFDSWRTVTSTGTTDGLSDGYKQSLDGNGALTAGLGDLTVRNVNDGAATLSFGMGAGSDGWHDIEIRIHNGAGGAGPNPSLGFGNYFGVGLNANGTTSLVGTDFTKPTDDGTMNLFRTTSVAKGNVDVDGGATVNAGGVQTIGTVAFGKAGTGSAQLNLSGGNASDADIIAVLGTGTAGEIDLAASGDMMTVGKLNVAAGNTFTKSGSGLLIVTTAADAGNTGNVNVTGGELRVEPSGSLLGSVVTTGGGIVSGEGTIAGGVSFTGSTLSPGLNDIGTLNITGAVSLDSASTVVITINDDTTGNMDVINNTGSFSAGGSMLSVAFNDTSYVIGTNAGDLAAATRYEFITGSTDGTGFGNTSLIPAGDLAALGLTAGQREITVGGVRFWLEEGSWALVPIAPIPEPGTAALGGLAALALLRRRRRA